MARWRSTSCFYVVLHSFACFEVQLRRPFLGSGLCSKGHALGGSHPVEARCCITVKARHVAGQPLEEGTAKCIVATFQSKLVQ